MNTVLKARIFRLKKSEPNLYKHLPNPLIRMAKYNHIQAEVEDSMMWGLFKHLPDYDRLPHRIVEEHQVDYKGSKVLVCKLAHTHGDVLRHHGVVVPGRVVSTDGNVSEVEPVTDKSERQELSNIVRSMALSGPIDFNAPSRKAV